jgi:hypothetical protein
VSQNTEAGPARRRPALLTLLAAEAVAVLGLALFLVWELLTAPADSFAAGLALVILAAIAAAFLIAVVIGAIRLQPWIRGAAVTWQLVQIAVAVGAFQGAFAQPDIGWLLLVPSLVVLVLLFSPPVIAVLRRD